VTVTRLRHTAAHLVRTLVAGVILAGLLLGVPLLLQRVCGWPLAWIGWADLTAPPGGADLATALTRPWGDEAILNLLVTLGWALWLLFCRDVALETLLVVAADPGRPRPTALTGHRGPLRLLAAALIGTIAAGLITGMASGHPPARASTGSDHLPRPGQVAAAALHVGEPTAPDRSPAPAGAHRSQVASTYPATDRAADPDDASVPSWAQEWPGGHYTVRAGDTLWDIAAEHDGDPHRWRDWYIASRDKPQADGRRLTDPDLIHPGWVLLRPLRAAAATPPTEATESEPAPAPGSTKSQPAPTCPPGHRPLTHPGAVHARPPPRNTCAGTGFGRLTHRRGPRRGTA
jgi:LysM repeat protein